MSSGVAQQLRRLFVSGTLAGLGEGALLDRYLRLGDDEAFEAIVLRHGPMVLAVCRRFLRDPHDVDDAFQATFLVLARKAAGLRRRDALGPWLHGVAYKVAARARSRRLMDSSALDTIEPADGREPPPGASIDRQEAHHALHEEVARLPERYQAPVVLCYFEGLTHDEAAARLRWPIGTVRGRLARARETLRDRLSRRGIEGSPALLAPATTLRPAIPLEVARSVARLSSLTSPGAAGAVAIRPAALALSQEALRIMTVKTVAWSFVAVAALAVTAASTVCTVNQLESRKEKPRREANVREAQTLQAFEDELYRSLKLPSDEDTATRIVEAREAYDARLKELEQAVSDLTIEIELGTLRIESMKKDFLELGSEMLKLKNPTPPESESRKALDVERTKIEDQLKRSLASVEAAKIRLDAAERELEQHRRRPRPTDRLELQVGDLVIIEALEALPGRPISGERLIRADGKVSLGFYGEIYLAGLTLDEAKEKIIRRLMDFLPAEVLGLIEFDPESGNPVTRNPRESHQVFIDRTWPSPQRPDPAGEPGGSARRALRRQAP